MVATPVVSGNDIELCIGYQREIGARFWGCFPVLSGDDFVLRFASVHKVVWLTPNKLAICHMQIEC